AAVVWVITLAMPVKSEAVMFNEVQTSHQIVSADGAIVFEEHNSYENGQMFTDTKGITLEPEITEAALLFISKGFPDNTYRPNDLVTRAQFIAMLDRGMANDKVSTLPWNIPQSNFAWQSIANLNSIGALAGYGKDFPNLMSKPITRGEVAKIVTLASGNDAVVQRNEQTFPDISKDMDPYIKKAYSMGVVNGFPDWTFRPDATATRGEAAAMVMRALWRQKAPVDVRRQIVISENDLSPAKTEAARRLHAYLYGDVVPKTDPTFGDLYRMWLPETYDWMAKNQKDNGYEQELEDAVSKQTGQSVNLNVSFIVDDGYVPTWNNTLKVDVVKAGKSIALIKRTYGAHFGLVSNDNTLPWYYYFNESFYREDEVYFRKVSNKWYEGGIMEIPVDIHKRWPMPQRPTGTGN
ncbi:MAG: S-layer homology domain-containing protein, partial [Bacillota bacterium]